jgi:hypothetical protein
MPDIPPLQPANDDVAIAAVTTLIKLDKAKEIAMVKQGDGSWIIRAKT